ncbi:aldehyde dehydrogenase family protein [Mesobaculum littorinae]|uniref:Aldehyde dehydrogenase family protein n=1 Tax=Mesobaculum littorinae TaxID=2486419 RepID=A0A438AMZ0_9RHOB|nr:aldehyde dehydrogenase family protein [Mesobaculum littorinae]
MAGNIDLRPSLHRLLNDHPRIGTGTDLAQVAACGSEDVDLAALKAREAFDEGRWRRLHPTERKDVMIRLCKLMTRNARDPAVMESLDTGKAI